MSEPRRLHEVRLLDLLAEQAEHGLDDAQARELASLLDELGPVDDLDGLELAAAAAYLAIEQEAGVMHEPMPTALTEKLIAQGKARVAQNAQAPATDPIPFAQGRNGGRGLRHPAWGWLAAAAVLAIAVTAWIGSINLVPAPDYKVQRDMLLSEADDVTRADWAPPEDPEFAQVTGDVVWSDKRQQGYMRLAGMPVNDPKVKQYQLWIVDPDVDTHPVDGGVFDVTETGEVIIPIDAKLRVDHPAVFAITVEQPGGVVVSAGPLRVVAAVGT
ncbi:MAG: anti-sigma factor [Phycisphaerales bacterium]